MSTIIRTASQDNVPHPEPPAIESWPVALRSLPRPEGISAMAEEHCRRYGMRKRDRAVIEDQILLQFHFGGGMVPVAETSAGPLVLARRIPEIDDVQNRAAFEELVRQQKELGHAVCFSSVPAWDDATTEI